MKLLSISLVLLSFLCFTYSGNQLFKRFNPTRLSFAQVPVVEKTTNQSIHPVLLEIPSLELALPIFPAEVENNVWETTEEGVSYLSSSPVPGTRGNSIIYGHNFSNLLGKLPQITPGEKVIITFSDSTKKEFFIKTTAVVDPSNPDVLKQTNEASLTIYTCTGFFDTKRFVVRAVTKN